MNRSTNGHDIVQILGPSESLWSPQLQESRNVSSVLANKVVLIYFSSQWCGPCRRFTPMLKELYIRLKAQPNVEDFEIILCSLDTMQADYEMYTKDMPWWCLPFGSPSAKVLADKFLTDGIPHLVILEKDGTPIVTDGVSKVTMDVEGKHFPWRPKRLVDLLPSTYLDGDRISRPTKELDNKYLMLYFSAHWCPPCRKFTPKLAQAYENLRKHRDDFEILFISSDKDVKSFNEYISQMPFGVLPYQERLAKAEISSLLQVRGIPALIMFGPKEQGVLHGDRPLINSNVRYIIEKEDYIASFPFEPKCYGDLNRTAVDFNVSRCIIVFHEAGDDEEQEEVVQALKSASLTVHPQDSHLRFLWATMPTGLTKTVRDALRLGPVQCTPTMVLLDIPQSNSYYVSSATHIQLDSIMEFLENPGERHRL